MALVECVKQGAIERLPKDFFQQLQADIEGKGFPPTLADKKHALLALLQEDPS